MDVTEDLLRNRGFEVLRTNARDINFFIKMTPGDEYNGVKLCMLVRNGKSGVLTKEQMENVAHQIENTMLLRGFRDIKILCMIFTDDADRDKVMAQTDIPVWLIDMNNQCLLVYENGPEDFEGLRGQMEQMLQERVPDQRGQSGQFHIKDYIQGAYMTIFLCLVNIAVFLVLELSGDTSDSTFMAMHGADNWRLVFENGEYYRLFTSMFLHFGIDHLASNMLMLFLVGRIVEKITGSVKFTVIYLTSGLAASFVSCFYYMVHNENVVSAGASGAIFGIMGALAMIALKQRNSASESFGKRMLLLFAFMILDGYMTTGVDFIAHLAGLVFGMVLTAVLYKEPNQQRIE